MLGTALYQELPFITSCIILAATSYSEKPYTRSCLTLGDTLYSGINSSPTEQDLRDTL